MCRFAWGRALWKQHGRTTKNHAGDSARPRRLHAAVLLSEPRRQLLALRRNAARHCDSTVGRRITPQSSPRALLAVWITRTCGRARAAGEAGRRSSGTDCGALSGRSAIHYSRSANFHHRHDFADSGQSTPRALRRHADMSRAMWAFRNPLPLISRFRSAQLSKCWSWIL